MEVNVSTFKAECLQLLNRLQQHGTEIIITKRGKPVARLLPIEPATPQRGLLGSLPNVGRTVGDIVSSTDQEWGDL